MVLSKQELEKFAEGKWLYEMSPNFGELGYIDRIRPRKICSHNGAIMEQYEIYSHGCIA